jgi:hypothetical protein
MGKVILWVVGVVLMLSLFVVLPPSEHVIQCGVDATGRPYAKVLVSNLLGRYHNSNWTGVHFDYGGGPPASVGFERPAHSITTTVVHADRFPKDVSGRTVRCSTWKDY